MNNPPIGGSSVVKPERPPLRIQVDIKGMDTFKGLAAALVLLYERADEVAREQALDVLREIGGIDAVAKAYGGS